MSYSYVTFVIQNEDCSASFFDQLAKIGGLIILTVNLVGEGTAEY